MDDEDNKVTSELYDEHDYETNLRPIFNSKSELVASRKAL